MEGLIRKIISEGDNSSDIAPLLIREWLVTNGLGGYASGTISGVVTRRYHGLLIAALGAPLGRILMLPHLSEQIRLSDGRNVLLSNRDRTGESNYLSEFWTDLGLPVWRYKVEGVIIEKRVFMIHLQNTVYVSYRLVDGPEQVRLKLLPSVYFRYHDSPVSSPLLEEYQFIAKGDRYEISNGVNLPTLRMTLDGRHTAFTYEPKHLTQLVYPIEESRGYDSQGDLFSPGYYRVDLRKDSDTNLIASTETWQTIEAISPKDAAQTERNRRLRLLAEANSTQNNDFANELVLAADQFIIRPAGRVEDAARVSAIGDEARTIIAGYHWFTDWGRDTMISLEGLTLLTGRQVEAGYILRTFANYIRDGLIPNLFPEGEREGLYNTADATLWFFHALARYLSYTHDRATLQLLLPKLLDIINHHMNGTKFGIAVDQSDGLLRQGAEGYQLTWMDAKVDNWVVTPRRGKSVEINALWYNALKLMEHWISEEESQQVAQWLYDQAEKAKESFNKRFWYKEGGYLYDVIDGPEGDDAACRPNQLFAFSLDYPVLQQAYWQPVLQTVKDRLFTPVGLRTLTPGHPDYKPQYHGDIRARDAAYHQGTVWAWLIGPFIDAWLRVYPDDLTGARALLAGFEGHLNEACIGTISEVFDAEYPYTSRGTVAQAWSVAEVLRSYQATTKRPSSV